MSNDNPSMTKLENDIVTTRDRLAQTIDELSVRAAPKNVIARQKEQAKVTFTKATRTESGELRMDRVAIAAAAVVGLVVLKIVSANRKQKKWERQRAKRSW
ncbi:hypothetical protein ASG73_09045 [Janibacter sp. Soil728]|uniref:DUF3618 domain-containing protein n=1 Tax=Janibacter sp. Soil728 TaxID=1736393 RepID=UPI0006F5528A|nr:DUF3618 domain-containing protein [Janibacter sp. Soil728]KRE37775.1 hypothetical protein ASG73_09045 [Janibacter sp. Soil728]